MTSRAEIVSRLLDPGVIPVIRANNADQVMPACEALLAGGLTALEITMTTPNALALIREASQCFAKRAIIGVGTVMTAEMCRASIEAGASFVVTPIMRSGNRAGGPRGGARGHSRRVHSDGGAIGP